jgi:subtilisin family serine protease
LRKKGYEVRDELVYRLFLNESLSSVNAPYTYIDPENNEITLTGANRVIGIIDTGIDPNHPDFADKIYAWRDSVEIVDNQNYSSTTPYDIDGHGTLVASIAAGTGSASNGKFEGIAPNAKLAVARACTSYFIFSGLEPIMVTDCKERYVEDALNWMNSLGGIDAVTMSFGSVIPEESIDICTNMSSGVNKAIADAVSNGIILVAAAGNEGPLRKIVKYNDGSVFYGGTYIHPACVGDVIAVGSTYKKDYSSYEFSTDLQDPLKVTSRIHVIIEVNGVNEKEYEWEAFNGESGGDYSKFGFDTTITPSSWPAVVKIKFEGMERLTKCNWFFGCYVDYEKWWPGNESKGDEFWEDEYTFDRGDQIVIQFSAWPKVEISSDFIWTYYHNLFYSDREFEKENGIEYYNVYYFIFNTTQKLKHSIPFWSNRGMLPHRPYSAYPDVVAPGHLICAANSSQGTIAQSDNPCGNERYIAVSGSSFAVPHVAGLVTLLKEANSYASYNEVKDAVIKTANSVYPSTAFPWWFHSRFDGIWEPEGHGRIDVQRAVDFITDCNLKYPNKGYSDSYTPQCSNYDYATYSSVNQMREYYWSDIDEDCDCSVSYDSYIMEVAINGITSGDVSVENSSYIYVDVYIKNTGENPQDWWYLGVEFWNVTDYNDPWGTRDPNGRINAYYNGKDGTHGCVFDPDPLHADPGNCPAGVDCTIVSESIDSNGKLDVDETIRVKCQAPASFYGPTGGNQRIIIWVHERDLGQDATNDGDPDGDGNIGDWWTDSLARSFREGIDDPIDGGPASIRVKIVCRKDAYDSDGGKAYKIKGECIDYYQEGGECKSASYPDECISSDFLMEYYVSGSGNYATCSYTYKNCKDYGLSYSCSSGRCVYSGGGGGGGWRPPLLR